MRLYENHWGLNGGIVGLGRMLLLGGIDSDDCVSRRILWFFFGMWRWGGDVMILPVGLDVYVSLVASVIFLSVDMRKKMCHSTAGVLTIMISLNNYCFPHHVSSLTKKTPAMRQCSFLGMACETVIF